MDELNLTVVFLNLSLLIEVIRHSQQKSPFNYKILFYHLKFDQVFHQDHFRILSNDNFKNYAVFSHIRTIQNNNGLIFLFTIIKVFRNLNCLY